LILESQVFQRLLTDRADERGGLARYTFGVLGLKGASAIPELMRQAHSHLDEGFAGGVGYLLEGAIEAEFQE